MARPLRESPEEKAERLKIEKELEAKGKPILKKLRQNKKLSKEEGRLLSLYLVDKNERTEVSASKFDSEYKRVFNTKTRSVSNKLKDQKGKRIMLRNNRFKIISDEPSPFTSSQFVALFRFSFKIKTGKTIVKTVPGYSPLITSTSFRSKEDLIKLVYKKALAAFLTSIGYNEGSQNAQRNLDVELVDMFYVSYVDYIGIQNYEISQAVA